MLRVAPSSAAQKGDATIQPAYFTSSLFVDALRVDAYDLARTFESNYSRMVHSASSAGANEALSPFSIFKDIWTRSGWHWLHLKVLEPRSRETFVDVVLRIFGELTQEGNGIFLRIAGVFGLYTFFETQPSTSTPRVSRRCEAIPICSDNLVQLLELPEILKRDLASLEPHVSFVLSRLEGKFLIMPHSSLEPMNPKSLPREFVKQETSETDVGVAASAQKKTGRRSKAERAQQTKRAVVDLSNWIDQTSQDTNEVPGRTDPAGRAPLYGDDGGIEDINATETMEAIHSLLRQRPMASLAVYRAQKTVAIDALDINSRHDVVDRAGRHVLQRLKEIDALTTDRGLEIGVRVGEHSALARVEKAVENQCVLHLLEGSG